MPMSRPPRWSADTELAFLFALRLTGSPAAACDAIGRSVQGTYARRARVPAFAARWDQVADELHRARAAAAHTGSISVRRTRHDGLTPLRRRAFLRALGESGRFDVACEHVGISVSAITKLRRREPGFDAECGAALARSTAVLEQAALEQATHGIEEPVFYRGRQVGTRRRPVPQMLRYLLSRDDARAGATLTPEQRVAAAHEAARAAGGEFFHYATAEETDKVIMRKLDAIERRRKRAAEEAAEEAAAQEAATRIVDVTPEPRPLPRLGRGGPQEE